MGSWEFFSKSCKRPSLVCPVCGGEEQYYIYDVIEHIICESESYCNSCGHFTFKSYSPEYEGFYDEDEEVKTKHEAIRAQHPEEVAAVLASENYMSSEDRSYI